MSRNSLYDVHHRKPRSIGGTNEHRNISRVPVHKHRAWHLLFSNFSPEIIAEIISEVWLDPDYKLVAVRRDDEETREDSD